MSLKNFCSLSSASAGPVPAAGPGKQPFCRETARYCYVVVRSDLSLEQQMVQAIHAAMAATAQHGGLTENTRLALLCAKGQRHLLDLAVALDDQGKPFSLFHEPDHGIGYSALATAPGFHRDFKILHKLPLWKGARVALNTDSGDNPRFKVA